MDPNTFPTKGNLIAAKNSLKLATMGYGLMDKKRNILIRELMGLIDEAKGIQSEIDTVFKAAYEALQLVQFFLYLVFLGFQIIIFLLQAVILLVCIIKLLHIANQFIIPDTV